MLASASFEGEEARFVDAFPSDFMAGTLLAFGIASALYRREHSGRGQHVRTSLYQAGLAVQHATANVFDAVDGWKREYAQWMQDERPHPREAAARRRRQSPVMVGGLYQTKDDRWITLGSSKRAFERLLDILGLDDPSVSDPAWEMPEDPHEHFAALRRRIRAVVSQFDGEDLRRQLQKAGVPCSLLESLEEAHARRARPSQRFRAQLGPPNGRTRHDGPGPAQLQRRITIRRPSTRPPSASTSANS